MFKRETPKWVDAFHLARELLPLPFFKAGRRRRRPHLGVVLGVVSGPIDDINCMEDRMPPRVSGSVGM